MRNFFRTEAAKLKKMNFTDKRQYIWEYYKLQIFFLGLIIFFIGYVINVTLINPPKREYLYISWQAHWAPHEQLSALGDNLSAIVENPERYRVFVQSYVQTGEPQMDQALATRFFAMLQAGDLHAMVTTREGLAESAEFGLIKPIQPVLAELEALDPILYDYISSRALIITYTMEDGETFTDAMGICIGGAPLMDASGIISDNVYISVIINSIRHYELAKALVALFS